MVIKASAAGEIRKLVESLANRDGVVREAAVARLAVIGPRAVPHLISAYGASTDRGVHAAVLRALEPIGDRRASSVARTAIREGGDVALAAVALLGGLLDSPDGTTGTDALDALMSTALDTTADRRVRLAAMATLRRNNMSIDRVEPLLSAPDNVPTANAAANGARSDSEDDAIWTDALDGQLPDDPQVLRDVLNARIQVAPLNELRKIVDRVRAREGAPGTDAAAWRALRGSIHQALAMRGSRVALYDLRETLESAAAPLPASFAAAAQLIGDASCLDAIAAAYSRSSSGDQRWQHFLTTAFAAIAAREKLNARHAVMKRISTRWPDAANKLWRTRPLPATGSRTARTSR